MVGVSLLALSGSGDTLGFQGGSVRSPDGKWRVSAAPVAGESATTMAYLSGPGAERRPLMRYERSAQILWPQGSGKVVLIERTIHFATFRAFGITGVRTPPDRIQADIVRGMAVRLPGLGTVENRLIETGGQDGAMCVSVEESGLPPGRDQGSFLSRKGAFRIDLSRMRASPTAGCQSRRR